MASNGVNVQPQSFHDIAQSFPIVFCGWLPCTWHVWTLNRTPGISSQDIISLIHDCVSEWKYIKRTERRVHVRISEQVLKKEIKKRRISTFNWHYTSCQRFSIILKSPHVKKMQPNYILFKFLHRKFTGELWTFGVNVFSCIFLYTIFFIYYYHWSSYFYEFSVNFVVLMRYGRIHIYALSYALAD